MVAVADKGNAVNGHGFENIFDEFLKYFLTAQVHRALNVSLCIVEGLKLFTKHHLSQFRERVLAETFKWIPLV